MTVRIVGCVAVLAVAGNASAAVFTGLDNGAGSASPRPNATAAFNSFSAAAGGPLQTVTFESQALGTVTAPLSVAPGVQLSVSGATATVSSDVSVFTGYNTTSGGNNFLQMSASTSSALAAHFNYTDPVNSWGAYFTGVGTASGTLTVQYVSGSTQSFVIAGGSNGGVRFWGVTDLPAPVASVSVVLSAGAGDVVGLDDVSSFSGVPAPGTASLLTLAGVLACRRRR